MRDVWSASLKDELSYWSQMIDGSFHRKEWVAGFRKRVAGTDIFPSHLKRYLKPASKILDVGAGPVTVLGGQVGAERLDIIAVDPLAEAYNELFRDSDLIPLVKTGYAEAEVLPFDHEEFDFVYSRNALDHSYDPISAIQNMINVCKRGGYVVVENEINEGVHENYKGLHQWNFMPADDDLVIWGASGVGKLLSKHVSGFAGIKVYVPRDKWVICEIVK